MTTYQNIKNFAEQKRYALSLNGKEVHLSSSKRTHRILKHMLSLTLSFLMNRTSNQSMKKYQNTKRYLLPKKMKRTMMLRSYNIVRSRLTCQILSPIKQTFITRSVNLDVERRVLYLNEKNGQWRK